MVELALKTDSDTFGNDVGGCIYWDSEQAISCWVTKDWKWQHKWHFGQEREVRPWRVDYEI